MSLCSVTCDDEWCAWTSIFCSRKLSGGGTGIGVDRSRHEMKGKEANFEKKRRPAHLPNTASAEVRGG